ncbi:AraC family transcriptional regulator [Microbacterium sp. nov. GSS16]|uniref:AraC family transcriptional regulator n=1 Tax=Microbacterium sp. nov. GSS16 TaxID=3019890 RepID=UPI0023066765|nr:helix-turn-helix domain-containing protein [Microbacterium sp. nov. GSS16]WCD92677.1 helix-turn-helix domain-containing protein [Microbacterium sp. nov. GSS16]
MIDARRGVLFPDRMPRFHRVPPTPAAAELVAWFWIPEWNLPRGETSRQEVVAYPALNLVISSEGVQLAGPTTRATHRDLRGRGWAVGAVLRPAGAAALTAEPAALRDADLMIDAPALVDEVSAAMAGDDQHARAAEVVSRWLAQQKGAVTDADVQANAMSQLLMTDSGIRTAEQAAARLAVSLRTLQRMAHRYVGMPPLAMIRRRRVQEAAQRLRDDPAADLSALAADLGYADHAHLTTDFRSVLGMPPSSYRERI